MRLLIYEPTSSFKFQNVHKGVEKPIRVPHLDPFERWRYTSRVLTLRVVVATGKAEICFVQQLFRTLFGVQSRETFHGFLWPLENGSWPKRVTAFLSTAQAYISHPLKKSVKGQQIFISLRKTSSSLHVHRPEKRCKLE